jgi:hypothetical protein
VIASAAIERAPRPLVAVGVVSNDVVARTLVVRLSETAEGYARLLWRQGHQALVRAEEAGYRTGTPTVWASAPGGWRVAFAVPGDGGTLRFHFHPGDPSYRALVSTPGLSATVVVDRGSNHIMNVRFHGPRT